MKFGVFLCDILGKLYASQVILYSNLSYVILKQNTLLWGYRSIHAVTAETDAVLG